MSIGDIFYLTVRTVIIIAQRIYTVVAFFVIKVILFLTFLLLCSVTVYAFVNIFAFVLAAIFWILIILLHVIQLLISMNLDVHIFDFMSLSNTSFIFDDYIFPTLNYLQRDAPLWFKWMYVLTGFIVSFTLFSSKYGISIDEYNEFVKDKGLNNTIFDYDKNRRPLFSPKRIVLEETQYETNIPIVEDVEYEIIEEQKELPNLQQFVADNDLTLNENEFEKYVSPAQIDIKELKSQFFISMKAMLRYYFYIWVFILVLLSFSFIISVI